MGRALVVSVGLAILTACVPAPPPPFVEDLRARAAVREDRIRWPRPPAETRIEYLGEIDGEAGFGVRRALWRRIFSALIGARGVRLVRPAALCRANSILAVADPGAESVHVIDLDRRTWTRIHRTRKGSLPSPVAVACLPDDRILVADSVLEEVWLYESDGSVVGRFGGGDLVRPTGLAWDPVHARIWISETLAHRVRAFDVGGVEILRSGKRGRAPGEFNYPTLLSVGPRGDLWVTDALNFRIQRLSADGSPRSWFGMSGNRAGDLVRPRGLAVDASGRSFVVDALSDAVKIFDAEGRLLLVFGGQGGARGEFWLPGDVVLDDRGLLWVADSYNSRIQVFAYSPPGDGA